MFAHNGQKKATEKEYSAYSMANGRRLFDTAT